MAHRGAPVRLIKLELMTEFNHWCRERKTDLCLENMIEFLLQKNYLKGKQFFEFVDNIRISPTWTELAHCEPLREGFIPPSAWITK